MPEGTVPSVLGLGLREAVVALEKEGYDVKFHGTGYVRQQIPILTAMFFITCPDVDAAPNMLRLG